MSISSAAKGANQIDSNQGWRRLSGVELLPYHLGRIFTYSMLGALAAMFAGKITQILKLDLLPSLLLVVGGLLFLAQFFGFNVKVPLPSLPRAMQKTVGDLSARYTILRGVMLGTLLGFLPCGLLLSALLVASSAPTPWHGAVGMLAFGLATIPALNLTIVAKGFLTQHKPQWIPILGKGLSLASAITLFVLAGVRLI